MTSDPSYFIPLPLPLRVISSMLEGGFIACLGALRITFSVLTITDSNGMIVTVISFTTPEMIT